MWKIENQTPFATGQTFTLDDQTGDQVWMVAVKATFDMSRNRFRLGISDEQEELYDTDEYRDEPHNSSLLHANDFALAKNKVDVLLDATAFAPWERPVTELMTGLIVGSLKKVLMVYGNRYYDRFLGFLYHSPPNQFLRMPLIYENAYGGWVKDKNGSSLQCELRNPAGTGFFKKRSSAVSRVLPNIEYADFPTKRKSKKNRIAGYGPIAPHWAPRIDFAGTSEESPERELSYKRPGDFNVAYYQSAPEDQQIQGIKGGESVVLYHMHPDFDEVQTVLPDIDIEFETLIDNQTKRQPGRLQSIIIKPDQLKLQLVWQANVSNGRDFSAIKVTRVSHKINQLY